MSNQAYLQGVAEALSQLNVDPQIKVASYNELEKVAMSLGALKNLPAKAEAGLQALRGKATGAMEALGGLSSAEAKALAKERARVRNYLKSNPNAQIAPRAVSQQAIDDLAQLGGVKGGIGRALMSDRAGDVALGLTGAGALTAGGLGLASYLDDSDEIAAAEALAADEERQRNLALALGGTALAGGLGYGAYKAMS